MNKKNQNTPTRIVRVSKKAILAFFIIAILWGLSLWGVWQFAREPDNNAKQNLFHLLNPRLATFELNTPEERAAKLFITLSPLKTELLEFLGDNQNNTAFYIEDLNTGGWAGWQEREEFIPASLLKVPVAMAALKEVDKGEWTLETAFTMETRYKDKNFGSLWQMEDGKSITLKQLIEEMLQYSDNTAANILFDKISADSRNNVYYHIGLVNPEAPFEQSANQPLFRKLTPKELATIFRALFNATYLTRRSSSYILEILTDTKFDKVLASEIPSNISVAHKVANFFTKDPNRPKNYHDCGIVYYPQHPYLYCVMTKEFNADVAQQFIVDIGNKIYRYFDKTSNQPTAAKP
ncbi:serine hydrolase [Patescibacteria group bacterium]|nr:MAG: serine hydrolase [Patescibacteria group bacterium]